MTRYAFTAVGAVALWLAATWLGYEGGRSDQARLDEATLAECGEALVAAGHLVEQLEADLAAVNAEHRAA